MGCTLMAYESIGGKFRSKTKIIVCSFILESLVHLHNISQYEQ